MNLRYALSIAVGLGLQLAASAQPPCLTTFAAPVGQTAVANAAWNPAVVPPTTSVSLNINSTAGLNTGTVTGCNAVLVGAPMTGPSFPGGTTLTACPGTFTGNALVSGSNANTFTLPQYGFNYPPQNTGIPAGVNCSVCPAVFSVNMCAGQYFTYQMCIGNIYTLSMCGAATNWDSFLAITTTAGTVLATGNPTSDDDGCGTAGGHATLSFVPTATGTYRVRLWQDPCTVNGALCGTIQVACNPVPPPPANDNPTAATNLPMSTTCNFVNTTNAFATQSTGTTPVTPTACGAGCAAGSGGYAGYDVWFSTTVAASGNLSIQTELISATNIAMAVYTGVPGTLTQVGGPSYCGSCNDDSSPGILNPFLSLSGLAPGSTVYIRVWSNAGLASMGAFRICAYEPIPPVNDNPCGSIVLPVNLTCVSTSFTTENATALAATMTLSPVTPTCGTPVAGGDVWFAAVMPPSGSMTFNTQAGSLTDMALAVYQLTAGGICGPGTLTQVACNDNNGAATMPSVTIGGAAGATYYVRMWNKTSSFGTASICAVQNTPPANDNPCGAIPLAVNTGCVFPAPFSTQFATITAGVPNPSCNAGPYNSDVWFTAVIPPSGQLILDTDDLGMTDAAMAVYTGPCAGPLVQVPVGNGGCVVGGSGNGAAMPMTTITGVAPGTTVYIRIWRQTNNDGTFLLCARNPQNPAGCYFTLRMFDTAGDGWNGGFVTVCVDPSGPPPAVCTNYTVTGALAFITFGAAVTDQVTLSYTPVGGFQNQVNFNLQASNGFIIFNSTSPPATGFNHAFVVNAACNVPPAPVSDCIGNVEVCTSQTFTFNPSNTGNVVDLNSSNDGCLAGEQQGVWFRFTTNAAGNIAFTLNVAFGTDYDFALWGPYAGAPVCPPVGAPLRCSWSGATGPTGLNFSSVDFTEGAGGDKWVQYIPALANQTYLLYVDNWSENGISFDMLWNNQPNTLIDCILPVEFLDLDAYPKARQVDLLWTTASEQNSAYYNVERAADGQDYKVIGTVAAVGHSQTLTEYEFTDKAPIKGVNYYRLDQVDANGDRAYSKVVTAVYRWGNLPITVFPNPAEGSLWANIEMPDDGNMRWQILDASGRVIRSGLLNAVRGVNQFEILLDIEAGSYLLEVTDEAGVPLGNARFIRQ